jgi:hypothetical protein
MEENISKFAIIKFKTIYDGKFEGFLSKLHSIGNCVFFVELKSKFKTSNYRISIRKRK